MDNLKLRAWDNFNETMIYNSDEDAIFILEGGKWHVKYIREKTLVNEGIEIDAPVLEESDEVDVMYYTGINDANGKEIYKGDILLDLWSKEIYEVKFGLCKQLRFTGWYVENEHRITNLNSDLDTNKNNAVEVRGNIYEN